MTDPDPSRLRRLFEQALELPPPARALFVEQKCQRDPALRARLEAMLRDAQADATLAPSDAAPSAPDATLAPGDAGAAPIGEGPGSRLGPYVLLQQIGEGGFGAVFLAEQKQPVQRRVALKILKPGMDTRQVVARFEQERQALALMDHPNIAKVLDAGATATGRPFFVMELVKGVPVTDYCDKNQLTIAARLALMQQICGAVQHAHQKGIIHRDLKPSNVLVGAQDGAPQVKVIDFGIAKATSQKLTDQTLFTEQEQVIGTLQYMSPEQAEGSLDIDTRTDVYSLGVMLYELLTGSTPFDRQTLRDAMYGEVKRMIREVEPEKPSTRLRQSRETLQSLAVQRRVDPTRLGNLVRGELDWIVMKALEKDRGRRYESAAGLAADLARYLGGEAVLAAPPSAVYRFKKLLRQNRGVFSAAAAVAAALLVGVVGFAWQASVAQDERDEAILARKAEAVAREGAEGVATLLESLFQGLDPGSSELAGMGFEDLVRRRVDTLAADVRAFEGEPMVRARLQVALATAKSALAQHGEALPMLLDANAVYADALGRGEEVALRAAISLAANYAQLGRHDEALDVLARARGFAAAGGAGAGGIDVAEFDELRGILLQGAGRYEEAVKVLEAARQRIEAGPQPWPAADLSTLNQLGAAYRELGRHEPAIALLEDVLRRRAALLGAEHPDTLASRNSLAVTLAKAGRNQEAIPLFEQTVADMLRHYAPDHATVLNLRANLASQLSLVGRDGEALAILEPAREVAEQSLGLDDLCTLRVRSSLVSAWIRAGRVQEAVALAEETVPRLREVYGADHDLVLDAERELAMGLQRIGRSEPSLVLFRRVAEVREQRRGPTHPDTSKAWHDVAVALYAAKRYAEAQARFEGVLAARRERLGPTHADTLATQSGLGSALWAQRQFDRSVPLLEETLQQQTAALGADDRATLLTAQNLVVNLRDAGRREDAAALATATLPRFVARFGADSEAALQFACTLAQLNWSLRDFDRAIALYEDALRRIETQPGVDPDIVLSIAADLAVNYRDARRSEQMVSFLLVWLPRLLAARGPDGPGCEPLVTAFLSACQERGRFADALPVLEVLHERLSALRGQDDPRTLAIGNNLGTALWSAGQTERALAVFEQVVARSREALGEKHEETLMRTVSLAINLRGAARLDEATAKLRAVLAAAPPRAASREFALRELAATLVLDPAQREAADAAIVDMLADGRRRYRPGTPQLAQTLAIAGELYLDLGAAAQAEPLLRDCLDVRQRTQPDAWTTCNVRSLLGAALVALGRPGEGEPLLVAGAEGLLERVDRVPPSARYRIGLAAARLVALHEANGEATEAARWRAVVAEYGTAR